MGKNQDPGSGINIPDPQHCSVAMVVVLACQATYAGEIDSFESILAFLKSLKIRALENFCLLDIAITSHFY
jgi:hypothetical protein